MAVIPPFMNRAIFYAEIRPLFGTMSQSQVSGLERLLDVWEQHYAADPIEFLSYDLGTSFHETGKTMRPIKEKLGYSAAALRTTFPKYFTAAEAVAYAYQPQRIANRAYANRMGNGNEASGDGYRYCGEGDVQNTGRENAAKATRELNKAFNLGIDLVANPGLRGDPIISAHSLFMGNRDGWWTGKKLGDYIKPGHSVNFVKARFVVNLQDEAYLIAGYANKFLNALVAAGAAPRTATLPVAPALPPKPEPSAPTAVSGQSFIGLLSSVLALFTRKAS